MSGRTFRGRTPDERVAERRAKLLEAALDLIGTEGWDAATMTAICRRAGLTERYFYESFKDREALYIALIEQIGDEVAAALRSGLEDADRDARVHAVTRALLAVLLGDPRKGRVALLEGLGSVAAQRRRRELLLGFERLARDESVALLGSGAITPRQAELGAVAMGGAVNELVSRRLEGTLDISDDELAAYIATISLRISSGQ